MYGLIPSKTIPPELQDELAAIKAEAVQAAMTAMRAEIEKELLLKAFAEIKQKMPEINELASIRAEKLIKDKEANDREVIRKKRHADSIALKDWVDKQPNPLRRTDKSFARELEKSAPSTSLEDPARVIYEHMRKKIRLG
ncbi:MAG: hypothetical protein K2Y10_09255 [Burkholderiaceae bacterium]|nr:hypothetical protein [Burkholderiaceae bacterium]